MSEVIDTFAASVCVDKIDILYQDEHILLISKPSGWQFSYASICSDTSKRHQLQFLNISRCFEAFDGLTVAGRPLSTFVFLYINESLVLRIVWVPY
jgi:hypothetical protein